MVIGVLVWSLLSKVMYDYFEEMPLVRIYCPGKEFGGIFFLGVGVGFLNVFKQRGFGLRGMEVCC